MSTTDQPVNPNKALWEKGDFTRIAETMRESGEELVRTLGVSPAWQVLDLGCGDGTTAVPEARLGADVLGVDIAENLVAAGNRVPQSVGLTNCGSRRAMRRDLDALADDTLRSRREHLRCDVRAEAVRRRQGDGAGDAARWADRHGQLDPGRPDARRAALADQRAYSPPPPEGFISPVTWGVEEHVVERFGAGGCAARTDRVRPRHLHVRASPGTPAEFLDAFRDVLRPDDERVRRGGGEWPRRASCTPSSRRSSASRTRARVTT